MSWIKEQALIVDGDPQARAAAADVLQAAGYDCHEREDSAAACDFLSQMEQGLVVTELELPDAVRVTSVDPNLFLLPAGLWDREVVQELAKSGMTSIFEKLRDEFDFSHCFSN